MDSAQGSSTMAHIEGIDRVAPTMGGSVNIKVGTPPLPKPEPLNVNDDSHVKVDVESHDAKRQQDANQDRKFHDKAADNAADVDMGPGDDTADDKDRHEWFANAKGGSLAR
eukprot:4730722-Karenia_brevis.AAC.1